MARQNRTQTHTAKKNTSPRKKSSRVAPATKAKVKTQVADIAPTALPGILAHSKASWQFAVNNRRLFARILMFSWAALLLVVGVSQYVQYRSIQDMASMFSGEVAEGPTQGVLEISVLLLSVLGGGQNVNLTETQQLVSGFIYLYVALITIWLTRRLLASSEVRFRDGLYSAGAPLVTVAAIGIIGLLQLLPLAIGASLVTMLSGVLQGLLYEVGSIIILALMGVLTLYWLITTVFAAMVATIPGMYPFAAWRSARQLVSGQRTALLVRLIWLIFVGLIVFVVVALILMLLGRLLGDMGVLLSSLLIQLAGLVIYLYAIVYCYLLYRKVVDGRS